MLTSTPPNLKLTRSKSPGISAKTRWMEHDDRRLIYDCNMVRPLMTKVISPSDALCEYVMNQSFRELLNTGMFMYVDDYFVVDNNKYVDKCAAEPHLTLKGQCNLYRIVIQFTNKETRKYCN
jgi:hypothetical protein